MYRNKLWLKTKYFKEGLLMREIADICGVQRATIEKWFLKHGLKGRNSSIRHTGKWNGRWKGGRQLHKSFRNGGGYILIPINGKRIREHRLVMEKHLGRKLLRSEVVHHKDGNSTNNNLDNLQLFRSLTEHQRYEDSLNSFAKNILFGPNKPDNHSELLSIFNKFLSMNGQDIST